MQRRTNYKEKYLPSGHICTNIRRHSSARHTTLMTTSSVWYRIIYFQSERLGQNGWASFRIPTHFSFETFFITLIQPFSTYSAANQPTNLSSAYFQRSRAPVATAPWTFWSTVLHPACDSRAMDINAREFFSPLLASIWNQQCFCAQPDIRRSFAVYLWPVPMTGRPTLTKDEEIRLL